MKYLVPIDFTPVTSEALKYALHISSYTQGQIEAYHLIKNETARSSAEKQFEAVISELSQEERSKVIQTIKVGDIFTDISKEAEEEDVDLLVMGTHGAKGLQRLFGSHAIKVITSSKTPFLVTQSGVENKDIKNIVLPIDLTNESTQIIRFAIQLAEAFQAKIHLVYRDETDEWLAKKLKSNTSLAEQQFKSNGIDFKLAVIQKTSSLQKDVINYALAAEGDLIAIAHNPKFVISQFDQYTQDLITNEHKIPVLIVDALQVSNVNSNYSFLSV